MRKFTQKKVELGLPGPKRTTNLKLVGEWQPNHMVGEMPNL